MSTRLQLKLVLELGADVLFGEGHADQVLIINSVSMMPVCIASITPPDQMNRIGIRIAVRLFARLGLGAPPLALHLTDRLNLSPQQMAFLTISIFALTGTPINGALITASNGSYVGATVFSGVVVLLGSGFLMWAWWATSRKKGTRWV